jgi:hypothetical protein
MGVIESHDDIESLLSIIDPHNNKQMTYSEVVQLLSSVIILSLIKSLLLVNGPS